MKKLRLPVYLFTSIVLVLAVLGFASFERNFPQEVKKPYPENVGKVLEKSCTGCHNTTSQNDKAKEKLNFSLWEQYNPIQKVGKFKGIASEVQEGKMPPAKFLERFPDRKLSQEEVKLISEWAKSEAEKIVSGK